MANTKTKVVDTTDDAAVEVAEKAAEAELPAAGHARREALKQRDAKLATEAEAIAQQILSGNVDATKMDIINEIAQRTQSLQVSNQQPGMVYGWVSKNQHGQHIEKMRNYGWEVVQGEDQEALELKGSGRTLGLGSPGTTRELADVILMRIPMEQYVVLRAMEIAQTKRVQQASASNLLAMADKYRGKINVHPYQMEDPRGDLSGPDIVARRFSNKQNAQRMMTEHIKQGTVPGYELNQ